MEGKSNLKRISSLEDDWEEIETEAQIKKKEEESIRLEQVIRNTIQNPQIEVPEHQTEEMMEEYKQEEVKQEEKQEHPQENMEIEKVEQPDLANEHVDETFIGEDDEISEEKQENDDEGYLLQKEKMEYQQTPAMETLPETFLESSWMNDIRGDVAEKIESMTPPLMSSCYQDVNPYDRMSPLDCDMPIDIPHAELFVIFGSLLTMALHSYFWHETTVSS